MGLDECVIISIYHCGTQNTSPALKIPLCAAYLLLSQSLKTTDNFPAPTVLPFPECHIVHII